MSKTVVPRKSKPAAPKKKRTPSLAAQILADLHELVETMKAGGEAAVEEKFTVRRVKPAVAPPPAVTAADVTAAREALGLDPAGFAVWLGVSAAMVRKWEGGGTPPGGAAARLIAEVRHDPAHWRTRLTIG